MKKKMLPLPCWPCAEPESYYMEVTAQGILKHDWRKKLTGSSEPCAVMYSVSGAGGWWGDATTEDEPVWHSAIRNKVTHSEQNSVLTMGIGLEESYSNSWSLKTIHCNKSWTTIWLVQHKCQEESTLEQTCIFSNMERPDIKKPLLLILNNLKKKKQNLVICHFLKVSLLICD